MTTHGAPDESRIGLTLGVLPRPLEGLGGQQPEAPEWFHRAMAMPVEESRIDVEGAGVEVLSWGERGRQGVLLMHGSVAHARWWCPIAQLLAKEYRVTAFSFSGNGGSDWRERYSVRQMAREAVAVAKAGGLFENNVPPTVVAHSFGGKAASLNSFDHGEELLGTILLDSFVVPKEAEGEVPPYKVRQYESLAEGLDRFRFSPDQPCSELYMVDAIARASLTQRDGKWTWCFDPDYFHKLDWDLGWDELKHAKCPLGFIRGEYSPIQPAEDFTILREEMRPDSVFVEIPDAYHHVMADQPLALTSALRAMIDGWRAQR